MNIKPKLIIAFSLIGISILFSCKKNTEQDIKGTWNRVLIDSVASNVVSEVWIIDDNKINITTTKVINNDTSRSYDNGNYIIKVGLSKKYLRSSGFSNTWYNNVDWRIERLKAGQLVLFSDRDNNFLYYEFTKNY